MNYNECIQQLQSKHKQQQAITHREAITFIELLCQEKGGASPKQVIFTLKVLMKLPKELAAQIWDTLATQLTITQEERAFIEAVARVL